MTLNINHRSNVLDDIGELDIGGKQGDIETHEQRADRIARVLAGHEIPIPDTSDRGVSSEWGLEVIGSDVVDLEVSYFSLI